MTGHAGYPGGRNGIAGLFSTHYVLKAADWTVKEQLAVFFFFMVKTIDPLLLEKKPRHSRRWARARHGRSQSSGTANDDVLLPNTVS